MTAWIWVLALTFQIEEPASPAEHTGPQLVWDEEMQDYVELPEVPEPLSLKDLDERILRQRLVAAYGEARAGRNSRWEVSRGGETQTWQWDGASFSCPEPELWDCAEWVPLSFKWFQTRNNWLAPWESFRRVGFFLDERQRPVAEEGRRSASDLLFMEDLEDEEASLQAVEELPRVEIGGRRLALETWEWTAHSGERVRVHTSLRENHWIEKIGYDRSVEYIEWTRPNRWTRPSISKVILDRDGRRTSFRFLPSE